MRVLMVHNTGSRDVPSGERIVFEQEARALRQLNFDVVQQVVDNESLRGNVFCRLAAGAEAIWSVPAYRQMLSSLHQLNPDIIHVHNIFPRLSGSIFAACARLHIPVVQTLHNYRYLCVEGGFFRANQVCQACLHGQSWNGVRYRCTSGSRTASAALTAHNLWHVRSGRLWSRVDRFIAVSEYVKRQHVSAGFPESSLVVKYHGVEAGTGVIQRGSPDTNAHDITFAGRLCAAKGTSILRELPPLLRPFKLQIVGAGPDETPLRAHFAASEMDNVTFAGAQSPAEVRRRISASRCVIVPSLCPESFGLVLAEAMACGVPVVASNVGALPELVGKSGGGLIVDPQDGATAFAQAVRHLLDQPRFARDLGERGREFARRELSLDQSVTRLVEIYRDVVMARRDKAMKS